MMNEFDRLSQTRQKLIERAWSADQHYGEPMAARNALHSHFAEKLVAEGLLSRACFHAENVVWYWATERGKCLYMQSWRFQQKCREYPYWSKLGT